MKKTNSSSIKTAVTSYKHFSDKEVQAFFKHIFQQPNTAMPVALRNEMYNRNLSLIDGKNNKPNCNWAKPEPIGEKRYKGYRLITSTNGMGFITLIYLDHKFEGGTTTLIEDDQTSIEKAKIKVDRKRIINKATEKPIVDKKSIVVFLVTCINELELGLGFHPDTSFEDYVDEHNGNTFRAEEANKLQKTMNQCFSKCNKLKLDIYEISLDLVQPYLRDIENMQEKLKHGKFLPKKGFVFAQKIDALRRDGTYFKATLKCQVSAIEDGFVKYVALEKLIDPVTKKHWGKRDGGGGGGAIAIHYWKQFKKRDIVK